MSLVKSVQLSLKQRMAETARRRLQLIIRAETLKKQASQQNAEYNRLADAHNKSVRIRYVVYFAFKADLYA